MLIMQRMEDIGWAEGNGRWFQGVLICALLNALAGSVVRRFFDYQGIEGIEWRISTTRVELFKRGSNPLTAGSPYRRVYLLNFNFCALKYTPPSAVK